MEHNQLLTFGRAIIADVKGGKPQSQAITDAQQDFASTFEIPESQAELLTLLAIRKAVHEATGQIFTDETDLSTITINH